MNDVFKFIFFVVIGGLGCYTSVFTYRFFNKKIKAATTGSRVLLYSLLLLLVCAALFVGCIFLLVYGYAWLAGPVK